MSSQNSQQKLISHTKSLAGQKPADPADIGDSHTSKRRRFVFTDPVAFRFSLPTLSLEGIVLKEELDTWRTIQLLSS